MLVMVASRAGAKRKRTQVRRALGCSPRHPLVGCGIFKHVLPVGDVQHGVSAGGRLNAEQRG